MTEYSFNADELIKEMDFVMRKGICKMLGDFMDRYQLLEKTHKQIMSLPSVLNELNVCKSDTSKDTILEEQTEVKNIDETNEKIDKLEKKLDKFIAILETFIQKNQSEDKKENVEIKSSIIKTCENENIKMEIKEVETIENKEEEEEEEQEEEEEEEQEEVEEEQVEEEEQEVEEEQEEEQEEEVEEEEEEEEEQEENEKIKEEEIETEASSDEEEEEEEFSEIEIDDVTYYTNDEENGFIYTILEGENIGDKVGYIKEGEPFFYAEQK